MKRVLFVGDAVVASGFAKATHAYCDGLHAAGHEVHLLGMHHTGDPTKNADGSDKYPYPIYTCWLGGDRYGIGRIRNMARQVDPDVIIIQQDPWNFPQYLENLVNINVPVIGVVAVDGKNCQGDKLGPLYDGDTKVHPGLSSAVFWTKFGMREAREGGWRGQSSVIPLGVDQSVYRPLDREALRQEILHPIFKEHGLPLDTFMVGSVGRNQPRKRLDLTIQYFAEWVHSKQIDDACLWLHVAPTGDDAYDLARLTKYFGVAGRVMTPDVNPRYGISEDLMAQVYNMFDVFMLTGLGEGWSLPTLEAMACGVPCIVPDWSALGEWAAPAAWLCECPVTDVAPNIMTVGGRVGQKEVTEALSRLYREPHSRRTMAEAGLKLASQPEYRWENIGAKMVGVVDDLLTPKMEVFEAPEPVGAV